MFKKFQVSICLVIVLALFAGAAYAQEGQATPRPTPTNIPPEGSGSPPTEIEGADSRGSIRGTVYDDLNGDGQCASEPALAGVPIKFVSDRGNTTVFLQSGENGTYGLVAAGLGTWTVTAEPGAGMVVTSKNPVQAFIAEDNNLVLGVNFCIAKGTTPGPGNPGPGNPGTGNPRPVNPAYGPVILPTAGASVAPALVATGVTGIGLFLAGFGLEINRRRTLRNERKKQTPEPNEIRDRA